MSDKPTSQWVSATLSHNGMEILAFEKGDDVTFLLRLNWADLGRLAKERGKKKPLGDGMKLTFEGERPMVTCSQGAWSVSVYDASDRSHHEVFMTWSDLFVLTKERGATNTIGEMSRIGAKLVRQVLEDM